MTKVILKIEKRIEAVQNVILMGMESIEQHKKEIEVCLDQQEKEFLIDDMNHLINDNKIQRAKIFAWKGVIEDLKTA